MPLTTSRKSPDNLLASDLGSKILIRLDIGQVQGTGAGGVPQMTGNRLGIDGLTVELKNDKGDYKLYVPTTKLLSHTDFLTTTLACRLGPKCREATAQTRS